MGEHDNGVPDLLPTPLAAPPTELEDMTLALYQRLAGESAARLASEQKAREQLDALARNANRTIAGLASERFEFERLLKRIVPMLEASGMENVVKVLNLYARRWDANLERAKVEVVDLAGRRLTDEMAEVVEVESAVPDPAVREITVRETLVPLVKIEGRVAGLAKVITSVPAQTGGERE